MNISDNPKSILLLDFVKYINFSECMTFTKKVVIKNGSYVSVP